MQVICKYPGRPPVVAQVDNTLGALQQAVGGPIETVTFYVDATIICNEAGRLMGLPYNCRFLGIDFVGPILVVGVDGDGFCSLSDEGAEFLMNQFGGA